MEKQMPGFILILLIAKMVAFLLIVGFLCTIDISVFTKGIILLLAVLLAADVMVLHYQYPEAGCGCEVPDYMMTIPGTPFFV